MIEKIISETDEVCVGREVGEDLYFKKRIKENIVNFECVDILIIDMTAVADTDEQVMQGIESLRMIDYKTRCIILAPDKKEGDSFLRECFYAGIYDIITTDEYLEMSTRLAECITQGMRYKDALRYRDFVEEEKTKTVAIQKVLVGVAGTDDRAGCTHNSIILANFLRAQGQMVAVLEMTSRKALNSVCEAWHAKVFPEGYFTLKGVDYYPDCGRERVTAISGKLYNFLILDFGNYNTTDKIMYNKCDVHIMISGTKPWELGSLWEIFKEQDEDVLKQYHFYFMITKSVKLQKEIIEEMKPLENVYFPEYVEDPFGCDSLPEGQEIFKEYLNNADTEKETKKKGLGLKLWKNRKK